MMGWGHINRAWSPPDPFAAGQWREKCPCPLLPCGFVDSDEANRLDCPQHAFAGMKTIRSHHDAGACPGGDYA